jgi:hypothetical protein
MRIAGRLVQRTAKDLAPKDTGALTRSVKEQTGGKGLNAYSRVFTGMEYAPYQEFGYTRKVNAGDTIMVYGKWRTARKGFIVNYAGKPFMRPALERNKELIEIGVKDFIQSYLKRYAK